MQTGLWVVALVVSVVATPSLSGSWFGLLHTANASVIFNCFLFPIILGHDLWRRRLPLALWALAMGCTLMLVAATEDTSWVTPYELGKVLAVWAACSVFGASMVMGDGDGKEDDPQPWTHFAPACLAAWVVLRATWGIRGLGPAALTPNLCGVLFSLLSTAVDKLGGSLLQRVRVLHVCVCRRCIVILQHHLSVPSLQLPPVPCILCSLHFLVPQHLYLGQALLTACVTVAVPGLADAWTSKLAGAWMLLSPGPQAAGSSDPSEAGRVLLRWALLVLALSTVCAAVAGTAARALHRPSPRAFRHLLFGSRVAVLSFLVGCSTSIAWAVAAEVYRRAARRLGPTSRGREPAQDSFNVGSLVMEAAPSGVMSVVGVGVMKLFAGLHRRVARGQ